MEEYELKEGEACSFQNHEEELDDASIDPDVELSYTILVSRALSRRKYGVSSIAEHSALSIWNRGEDNIVFTLYL
ncbi:hypothetical protein HN51_054849 [Arachis hypogaea]